MEKEADLSNFPLSCLNLWWNLQVTKCQWNTETLHSLCTLYYFHSDSLITLDGKDREEVASTSRGNQIQPEQTHSLTWTHYSNWEYVPILCTVCFLWDHSPHTYTCRQWTPADFSPLADLYLSCWSQVFSWDRAKQLTNSSLLIGSGSVFIGEDQDHFTLEQVCSAAGPNVPTTPGQQI